MKKLLLFFSLLLSLLPLSAAAETETITFKDVYGTTDKDLSSETIIKDYATISFAKNDGSNPTKYFKSDNTVRIYRNTTNNNGGSITITPTTGYNITAVSANVTTPTISSDDNGVYTIQNKSDSNISIKSITIEYSPAGPVDFEYTLPATKEIEEGEIFDLGLPEKRPTNITWESDKPEVAVIEDGVIYAYAEGTANIKMTWAADDNFNASSEDGQTIVVTVQKHQLVEYNPGFPESVNLVLGNTDKDYYDFVLGDKHPAIKWTVSNTAIADMNDNSVYAVAKGSAVVKATWEADDNFLAGEASTTVNVVEEIVAMFTPSSVTTSIDPAKGGRATAKFEAAGKEDIANDNFNFTSSDESVATYDPATGIVTLKAVGSATITATLTEEAAKEYVFADDVDATLSISVADINGPIGYELVTSLDQITDEDYYVIVANYDTNGTSYHKAMAVTMGNNAFNSTDVTITNGLVNPTESTLILSAKKTAEGKYIWTTTNRESNGNLQGNNTHSNNNLQCGSTGNTYSDVATVSFTDDGKLDMYFGTPTTISKKLLYSISNSAFKNYATSNIGNASYAQVSLYRLNFVKAEAPAVEDFEGKGVGDQVKFTVRHSSHKLQYREWTLAKTISRAEPKIQYGEWMDAPATTTHTHIIKDLEEVGDNLAAHGVDVRAVDTRGNVSSNVGFSFDGQKTVTGIESVAAEAEGEGELYNLQGVRVDRRSAAPGLYIERRGGKAVKVIL